MLSNHILMCMTSTVSKEPIQSIHTSRSVEKVWIQQGGNHLPCSITSFDQLWKYINMSKWYVLICQQMTKEQSEKADNSVIALKWLQTVQHEQGKNSRLDLSITERPIDKNKTGNSVSTIIAITKNPTQTRAITLSALWSGYKLPNANRAKIRALFCQSPADVVKNKADNSVSAIQVVTNVPTGTGQIFAPWHKWSWLWSKRFQNLCLKNIVIHYSRWR